MTVPDSKLLPVPDPVSRPYWDAAADHRLVIQRCTECARHQFYPRRHCTHCGSLKLEWTEAAGHGTVHTFTVIHRNSSPGFSTAVPYAFAIVDLPEGVRMSANIVGVDAEKVRVGMPVHVTFEGRSEDLSLPQFTPTGAR